MGDESGRGKSDIPDWDRYPSKLAIHHVWRGALPADCHLAKRFSGLQHLLGLALAGAMLFGFLVSMVQVTVGMFAGGDVELPAARAIVFAAVLLLLAILYIFTLRPVVHTRSGKSVGDLQAVQREFRRRRHMPKSDGNEEAGSPQSAIPNWEKYPASLSTLEAREVGLPPGCRLEPPKSGFVGGVVLFFVGVWGIWTFAAALVELFIGIDSWGELLGIVLWLVISGGALLLVVFWHLTTPRDVVSEMSGRPVSDLQDAQRQRAEREQDRQEVAGRLRQRDTLSNISGLTPRQFEFLVARLLRTQGYDTTVTPASGDMGADILAERGSELVAVEVKATNRPIGPGPVQRLAGALAYHGATRGMVVSLSGFTRAGEEAAEAGGIALYGPDELGSDVTEEMIEYVLLRHG